MFFNGRRKASPWREPTQKSSPIGVPQLGLEGPSCCAARAATGRSFGDKDFRGNLENGIFLCELLSTIKPGLVKKINRLPTPIAGLATFRICSSGEKLIW
uniref:Calponin-homology (CH) domain-containing protein n=1 Tax=Oryzias latipes TaxID=8090 RepID=A0A3P9JV92_ORYLA